MKYTAWRSRSRFQDDPQDVGRVFVDLFLRSGLDLTLISLAQTAWQKRAKLCFSGSDLLGRQGMTTDGAVVDGGLAIEKDVEIGKRNVVFRLRMPDRRTTWIARLRNPLVQRSTETDPDVRALHERLSLESEVATMQYVRANTKIPVPELYAYDLDPGNKLGTSYMLMECLAGKPFPHPFVKHGFISDADIVKIHSQLVNISSELAEITFNTIGQLRLDPSTNLPVIGEIIDRKGRSYGPFDTSESFFRERARVLLEGERHSYHGAALQTREDVGGDADADGLERGGLGSIASAHLHVLAAPYATNPKLLHGPFPLKHVDLHWQNLLLDDQCIVVGIIDWEWSHTVPVESVQPLPFNVADFVLPYSSERTKAHADIAWKIVEVLGRDRASSSMILSCKGIQLSSLRYSLEAQVAACLDRYNWANVRSSHAALLRSLMEERRLEVSSTSTTPSICRSDRKT
jgi:hypothetical protein